MKSSRYLMIALLLIGPLKMIYGQDAKMHLRDLTPKYTVVFLKVYGKCGLCTMRILNALKVKGVKSAFWSRDNQLLTLQYDMKALPLEKVYSLIAGVGHDTEKIKAKDAVYYALPICCRYRNEQNFH